MDSTNVKIFSGTQCVNLSVYETPTSKFQFNLLDDMTFLHIDNILCLIF